MKKLAAIDIGTNSMKLLVAAVEEDGSLEVLSREKAMVRLGSDTLSSGRLSPEAIEAGASTVEQFLTVARGSGAEVVRAAPSSDLTTYRTGGPFGVLVRIPDETTLLDVRTVLQESRPRILILGRGSNVLVADAGFSGVALLLTDMAERIETLERKADGS